MITIMGAQCSKDLKFMMMARSYDYFVSAAPDAIWAGLELLR